MRAAVFGTYDIIVSTAGLVLGVAAGGTGAKCNLIGGRCQSGCRSMTVGEYVSVSLQTTNIPVRARPFLSVRASGHSDCCRCTIAEAEHGQSTDQSSQLS